VNKLSNKTYEYTTYIASTSERVWTALTTSSDTAVYFFGRKLHSSWIVGEKVTFLRELDELDVVGDLIEFTPYKKISYTWTVPEDTSIRNQPSIVTFLIKQLEGTVKLTLIHSNLVETDFAEASDTFAGLNNGWPAIISNLKSYLETGKPLQAIKA
jgi:uncharacterized protein YndB with AHSA1/START domain